MKKLLLLIFSIISLSSYSQNEEGTRLIFNPYIGGPNFHKDIEPSYFDYDVHILNKYYIPILGFSSEYYLNNELSIGIDFNYTKTAYLYKIYSYVDSLSYHSKDDRIKSFSKTRLGLRITKHGDLSNPFLDFYYGIGVGLVNRNLSYTVNNIPTEKTDDSIDLVSKFPLYVNIYSGLRYTPVEHFGFSIEAKIGGPFLAFGVYGYF